MSTPLPPIAILAGGMATRMRPLTDEIPKAMIPVAGEPFIAHQLRLLAEKGLTDVVLLLGYRGEQIEQFVGDGARFSLRVRYQYDGKTLLGTGGAIRRALPLLGPQFFVLYGDSYLDIDYRAVSEAFDKAGADGLMTVYRNSGQFDRSNVLFADGRVRFYSKTETVPGMDWIDYGLSLLRCGVLADWPTDQAFGLDQVFERLARDKRLAGFEVSRRFFEIGSVEGLRETEAYIVNRKAPQI
jgi:N-acetyl-alpha-D-muramate 1-phosphate uridylyltransferase